MLGSSYGNYGAGSTYGVGIYGTNTGYSGVGSSIYPVTSSPFSSYGGASYGYNSNLCNGVSNGVYGDSNLYSNPGGAGYIGNKYTFNYYGKNVAH